MIPREASVADREAVVVLWDACGLTRPWNDPHRDFARAIDGPTSTVLVVPDGEAIVGSIMVGFDGHRGWAYYLAVSPGGVGRTLMAAAETWLAAKDVPKI